MSTLSYRTGRFIHKKRSNLRFVANACLIVSLAASCTIAFRWYERMSLNSEVNIAAQTTQKGTQLAISPVSLQTPPVHASSTTPPVPSPASNPAVDMVPVISFDTDPCYVTITGNPGTIVAIGATNGRKGNEHAYVLPATGKVTASSGGMATLNMTSYGVVYDKAGAIVLFQSSPQVLIVDCPSSN